MIQRVPDETPFPITLKEHGVDFLMEHRHLWLRTPRQSAILRVRATIMRAAAEYFDENGFIRTDPPILTPNACEGTSELFEMDYFEERQGLPDTVRPTLRRGDGAGAGQGLQLRPDVSRGEVEDPATPHGVLDGRTRDGVCGVGRVAAALRELPELHRW